MELIWQAIKDLYFKIIAPVYRRVIITLFRPFIVREINSLLIVSQRCSSAEDILLVSRRLQHLFSLLGVEEYIYVERLKTKVLKQADRDAIRKLKREGKDPTLEKYMDDLEHSAQDRRPPKKQ